MKQARTIIITGDGKGKTTAALGMAIRAAGHNIPVTIIQFIKNNTQVGELKTLAKLPNIKTHTCGLGFVYPDSQKLPQHQTAAQQALKKLETLYKNQTKQMIILDEICTTPSLNLISEEKIIQLITNCPAKTILILTGRNASPKLIEQADTVSHIKNIRHAYQQNIPAQKGVEY